MLSRGSVLGIAFLSALAFLVPFVFGSPYKATRAQRADVEQTRTFRTNAQRLAAGLPPLKPRTPFDPSRVRALAPRQSGNSDLIGTIAVYSTSDPAMPTCYIGPSVQKCGAASAAQSFSIPERGTGPVDIETLGADLGNYMLWFTDGAADTLTTTNGVFLELAAGSPPTGAGAPPQAFTGQNNFGETTVWTVAADGTVTATWINPTNASPASVELTFFLCGGVLYATADPSGLTCGPTAAIETVTFEFT